MTNNPQKNIREIIKLTNDSTDAVGNLSDLVNRSPSGIAPYKTQMDVCEVIAGMMARMHDLSGRVSELEDKLRSLKDKCSSMHAVL